MKITAVNRPFILTFHATNTSYPLTAEEAQRLLDEYPAVTATRNRVVLVGHNTADPKHGTTIRPATLGGGPSFVVEWQVRKDDHQMNIIALNRIDTLCEGGWHQSLGTLRKAHKCLDCAAKIPAGSRDAWTRPLRMPGKRFTVYEFLCATCCFRVQG